MSSEVVSESEKPSWFAAYWRLVLGAFGVVILILAGVAFWPDTKVLGEKGPVLRAKFVEQQFERLRLLRAGTKTKIEITEKDLNTFLAETKTKKWEMASVSVAVSEGYLTVNAVKTITSITMFGHTWEPCYSYTLVCVPAGNAIYPSKAKFGHLTMVGPFRRVVVNKLVGLLAQEREWEVLRGVQEVKLTAGKIGLTIGK
jgi:hypothetical protein